MISLKMGSRGRASGTKKMQQATRDRSTRDPAVVEGPICASPKGRRARLPVGRTQTPPQRSLPQGRRRPRAVPPFPEHRSGHPGSGEWPRLAHKGRSPPGSRPPARLSWDDSAEGSGLPGPSFAIGATLAEREPAGKASNGARQRQGALRTLNQAIHGHDADAGTATQAVGAAGHFLVDLRVIQAARAE